MGVRFLEDALLTAYRWACAQGHRSKCGGAQLLGGGRSGGEVSSRHTVHGLQVGRGTGAWEQLRVGAALAEWGST